MFKPIITYNNDVKPFASLCKDRHDYYKLQQMRKGNNYIFNYQATQYLPGTMSDEQFSIDLYLPYLDIDVVRVITPFYQGDLSVEDFSILVAHSTYTSMLYNAQNKDILDYANEALRAVQRWISKETFEKVFLPYYTIGGITLFELPHLMKERKYYLAGVDNV